MDVDQQVDVIGFTAEFHQLAAPGGKAIGKRLQGQRGGTLRLGSGKEAMAIRVRGQHHFGPEAKPNDLTIIRKNGEWFASVTLRVPKAACARERRDHQHRGVDFGLTDWATFDNGETIANPR